MKTERVREGHGENVYPGQQNSEYATDRLYNLYLIKKSGDGSLQAYAGTYKQAMTMFCGGF